MVQTQSYVNYNHEVNAKEPAHYTESLRLDVENMGQTSAVILMLLRTPFDASGGRVIESICYRHHARPPNLFPAESSHTLDL